MGRIVIFSKWHQLTLGTNCRFLEFGTNCRLGRIVAQPISLISGRQRTSECFRGVLMFTSVCQALLSGGRVFSRVPYEVKRDYYSDYF